MHRSTSFNEDILCLSEQYLFFFVYLFIHLLLLEGFKTLICDITNVDIKTVI